MPRTLLALLLLAALARAHDGPPYAVLVDEPCGPWRIEVWTDPDIGTGTFLVLLSAPPGGPPAATPAGVQVAVAPRDGRHPQTATAARREDPADGLRWFAEVPFPDGGWWTARFLVHDGAAPHAAQVEVEVTPPGLGGVGLALYLFPFLAVGVLFLLVVLRRRRGPAAR